MLSVAPEDVAIAHSISEIGTLPVTCVVECSTPEEYSQLITICLSERAAPAIPESASRLALRSTGPF
ncbi:hypothetical protein GA0061105_11136 [Rhizobium aethiopicum]|uniref:Uncharacterized protein n=1 Tax=Rhizobium aethiopicum TaxID=1138170 RepID=A0A1C3Y7T2_9HYPH|nr:hypothetical protein [Rhizobium aethiopicum]SCB60465.1 hypothetical protein GA0061105_11136 [Rhizobium aethiopicum]